MSFKFQVSNLISILLNEIPYVYKRACEVNCVVMSMYVMYLRAKCFAVQFYLAYSMQSLSSWLAEKRDEKNWGRVWFHRSATFTCKRKMKNIQNASCKLEPF